MKNVTPNPSRPSLLEFLCGDVSISISVENSLDRLIRGVRSTLVRHRPGRPNSEQLNASGKLQIARCIAASNKEDEGMGVEHRFLHEGCN